MAYQELSSNGIATVEVNAERLELVFHQTPFEKVRMSALDGPIEGHFQRERFRVRAGSGVLERDIDGEFWRWREDEARWVEG
jgi:hypothetical protein